MKTYLISEKLLNEVFYFLVEEVHSESLIKRLNDLQDQLRKLKEVEHDDNNDDYSQPLVIYQGKSNLKVKMKE